MVDFSKTVLDEEVESTPKAQRVNWSSVELDEADNAVIKEIRQKKSDRIKGLAVEFGEGITLGFLGELAAAVRSADNSISYREAKDQYEAARERFREENPDLADSATILNFVGSIPTSFGIAGAFTKAGSTLTKAATFEGATVGFATGDSFQERLTGAAVGGLAGLTVGKVIDLAVKPSSAGGLKAEIDDFIEATSDISDQSAIRAIQEAEEKAIYTEIDAPQYSAKPLSEAQTAGELWVGLKSSLQKFYDDKMTGVSDRVMRRSPEAGARLQVADEAATRKISIELDELSEQLVPVIKIINEDERLLGTLLDFSAGKLAKGFDASVARLEKEFANDLNSVHMNTLKQYLNYSRNKNASLNKLVIGFDFGDEAFLHTNNRAMRQSLKDQGKTEIEIEKALGDRALETRTRGSYLDPSDPKRPKPADYENPIVSDMRRIFQMQKFAEIQRKFSVDVEDYKKTTRKQKAIDSASVMINATGEVATDPVLSAKKIKEALTTPLTPFDFLDAFEQTLKKRGLSEDTSIYIRDQITDSIFGQSKAPHPLIQAANSLAYALTLAGPLSAVLNLADIPLIGAKYGGAAVREGLQATNPFAKVANVDLKKIGLNNQTFGEFMNIINDRAAEGSNWMVKTADSMRKSADFLMKGSFFVAFDRVGKKGVMRGILKSAVDDVNADKLADNWGFYFNPAELKIISNQLKKHGTDWTKYTGKGAELVEELMVAGLGQQQLISAFGRPAAWARHPNLRPLWALRGFVVKQQALALREVVGNLKAGRPDKAAEFLGRYAAYGAGGYAVINEGRQFIFGDGEVSASGLARGYGDAWASLLTANTLGLNDYQFGKIKQNGILLTAAEGLMPIAVTRPLDILGTTIGVVDREYPAARLASEVPIIRDIGRVSRNIGERAGIEPLEEFGGMLTQKRLPEAD